MRAVWKVLFTLAVVLLHTEPVVAAGIPREAERLRPSLVRVAQYHWGLDAPVAVFAAQIHAESRWNAQAVSPVGAQGLAQFMPATSDWISGLYEHLEANEPRNPQWAMAALVTYDRWLWDRVSAASECSRMPKALAAYNGGLGWVRRDERLAAQRGLDPAVWFGSVETVNAGRSAAAKRENTEYPRKILFVFQPLYSDWGLGVRCED